MLKLCKIHACPNGTLGLHLSRAPWDPYPWVSGVQDGSNAYQAGVRSGDTVLELNGSDVLGQKISELAAKIQNHWERGGNFVTVLIWRNKTENSAINQQSLQKFAKCLQNIAQLLECPVCLEVVKPPGWQCCNGHVLCNSCRGRTVKCPICRVTLGPRGRCLLSDKLFTLLAESFPCDGVRNGNSSSDCPKDYNDCHETPLISPKIDSPPSSASSSPTLDKVHQRKGNTILENLKEQPDNNQLAADGNSLDNDNNIVVLKVNLRKKKDFLEHGSLCQHHNHHHHHHHHRQRTHHHAPHSHHRPGHGQQHKTFHCPTGKSSCSLLQQSTDRRPDPDTNTEDDAKTPSLDCIWTQDVVSRKPKGEESIETLGKFITEWDVMSHLTQVHQISVAQHYTTFGQVVRMQLQLNTKLTSTIPCITIQSERIWNQNKENLKNNVNVSAVGGEVGGVLVPCSDEKVQGHALQRRYKNSRTASAPKNVHRPSTELFFVACIPMDEAMDTEGYRGDQQEDGLQNEMNADTRGDTQVTGSLQLEFDDCRAAVPPVFVGFPSGPPPPSETAKKSKCTYSQTTGHLIPKDPRSEFSATLQGEVNAEHPPSDNSPKFDACTWCTMSLSSSTSLSSSSSSYRCCSNTRPTNRQHAIFIWYFGSDGDVKNFQTVIECKRTGLKWTGCVHPLTESWPSIRQRGLLDTQQRQFLVLNSLPDAGDDDFFDIVIKIK